MADLTKPSNIVEGGTIQDTDVGSLYDILLGTSNYDNISMNGVKVWAGILAQSSTNAPTATVIYNTLGGAVAWTRISTGVYRGTQAGAFTSNKTICMAFNPTIEQDGIYSVNMLRTTGDYITLQTLNASFANQDIFSVLQVLILVFP